MENLGSPIRFGKERSCEEIGGFLLLHKQDIAYFGWFHPIGYKLNRHPFHNGCLFILISNIT